MKKKVLYFGNETVPSDRAAIEAVNRIEESLPGIDFIHCNSPEDIMRYGGEDFFVLDVARGIKKITIFSNPDLIKERKINSLHDFDLGFFLKLLKKLKENEFRVIAIPQEKNCDQELTNILKSYEI